MDVKGVILVEVKAGVDIDNSSEGYWVDENQDKLQDGNGNYIMIN